MKNIFLIMFAVMLFVCGCNSIGNGVSKSSAVSLQSPEVIDIQGDWRVDIRCGADNDSCIVIIDENLSDAFKVKSGKKFAISLPETAKPMVIPVVRISLKKPFAELSMADGSVCNVRNLKTAAALKIEMSGKAAAFFRDSYFDKVKVELEDGSKLSLAKELKGLWADISDYSVLEAESVEELAVKGSDFSRCRIKSCNKANVDIKDAAEVEFKKVRQLERKISGNAQIKCPSDVKK